LTITLRVYNFAHIATELLSRSEKQATAIFRQAGVKAIWVDCPSSPADSDKFPPCHQPLGPADLVLKIRSTAMTPKDTHGDILGSALLCLRDEVGCSAEIFYQRAADWAVRARIPGYQLIGHAMAHEIGHLLLGLKAHSQTETMRANWDREDLRRARLDLLHFTDQEAEIIRAKVLDKADCPNFENSRVPGG